MRALVQRVSDASVRVSGEIIGEIGPGLLVFVCAMRESNEHDAVQLAHKIAGLRVFRDAAGKMNLPVGEAGGALLVISQFTLAADTRRGNRPGFSAAAPKEAAEQLYLRFAQALRDRRLTVETGRFGADMQVALTNDGPVTLWLDTAQSDARALKSDGAP